MSKHKPACGVADRLGFGRSKNAIMLLPRGAVEQFARRIAADERRACVAALEHLRAKLPFDRGIANYRASRRAISRAIRAIRGLPRRSSKERS